MSLQAKAVELVFDINADPNEHMKVNHLVTVENLSTGCDETIKLVPVGVSNVCTPQQQLLQPQVDDSLSGVLPQNVVSGSMIGVA